MWVNQSDIHWKLQSTYVGGGGADGVTSSVCWSIGGAIKLPTLIRNVILSIMHIILVIDSYPETVPSKSSGGPSEINDNTNAFIYCTSILRTSCRVVFVIKRRQFHFSPSKKQCSHALIQHSWVEQSTTRAREGVVVRHMHTWCAGGKFRLERRKLLNEEAESKKIATNWIVLKYTECFWLVDSTRSVNNLNNFDKTLVKEKMCTHFVKKETIRLGLPQWRGVFLIIVGNVTGGDYEAWSAKYAPTNIVSWLKFDSRSNSSTEWTCCSQEEDYRSAAMVRTCSVAGITPRGVLFFSDIYFSETHPTCSAANWTSWVWQDGNYTRPLTRNVAHHIGMVKSHRYFASRSIRQG